MCPWAHSRISVCVCVCVCARARVRVRAHMCVCWGGWVVHVFNNHCKIGSSIWRGWLKNLDNWLLPKIRPSCNNENITHQSASDSAPHPWRNETSLTDKLYFYLQSPPYPFQYQACQELLQMFPYTSTSPSTVLQVFPIAFWILLKVSA